MASKRLKIWIEGAIVAALAIVLSMIPTNIGSSFTVSLGMIPLTIYSVRRGYRAGMYSGLMWGLLHFLVGNVVFLSVLQVLIEYLLAFTFAGFAGLYANKVHNQMKENNNKKAMLLLVLTTFVGCLARFFWHFVAGVAFWGSYALWGMNPFVFSLIMNGASGLGTAVVTAIVVVLIYQVYPTLITPENGVISR